MPVLRSSHASKGSQVAIMFREKPRCDFSVLAGENDLAGIEG